MLTSTVRGELLNMKITPIFVRCFAWALHRIMGTSGAESLAAAANVFLGQVETPLLLRNYIRGMTRSELNSLMVGGFATITGSLVAVYTEMGVNPAHLIAASVISAPASLVISKLVLPETEHPRYRRRTLNRATANAGLLGAVADGVSDGVRVAVGVAAMIIVFLAGLSMVDDILQSVGTRLGLDLTLGSLLGQIFLPVAWLLGIELGQCAASGEILRVVT